MKIWLIASALAAAAMAGCGSTAISSAPKNVIFFLGDGMGMTTQTAARIYKVGEDGELTMDTLPETAFVKTYSNNAQVTDSAPSMAAYMTGVKMNNEVISMTPETSAFDVLTGKDYLNGTDSTCPASGNGKAVPTLLEIAKAAGMGTGAVTTTRVTHATPATTYSHVCHRDGENTIAAQAVPGGSEFNAALGDGLDVLMGGGRQFFLPSSAGGKRTDGRDLTAELKAKGYNYVKNKTEFDAAADLVAGLKGAAGQLGLAATGDGAGEGATDEVLARGGGGGQRGDRQFGLVGCCHGQDPAVGRSDGGGFVGGDDTGVHRRAVGIRQRERRNSRRQQHACCGGQGNNTIQHGIQRLSGNRIKEVASGLR